MEWDRLTGPAWIGMDTATAFLPWYSFLGEQLRAGHIPTWNPHTFAGTPFAADPESGWMYLPAMLAFTLLPLDAAVRANLLVHVLLAALSMYALARVLGCNVWGALLAGTIYAHSGFFEGHNVCCYAYAGVAAWLPLTLLGAELAIRSAAWRPRVLWWGVAGLAMSQILAAWIGQGAYYAVLVLGSYVICRILACPHLTLRSRLERLGLHLGGIALLTMGLAAAGVLPRLEYNLVSNLPGGYPDAYVALRSTAWNAWGVIADWDRRLVQPGFGYIGWIVVVLSCAAIPIWIVSRRPDMLPYFAVLGLAVLVLTRAEPTPLHTLFSLLPGFERIHARSPERALMVLYIAPAMLSAASLTWLTSVARRGAVPVGVGVVVLVSVNLRMAWTDQAAESLGGGGDYQFARVDLADYVSTAPGARFLMEQARSQPAFRYFGFAGHVFGGPMPYTLRWADPTITALQVDNRGLLTALQDIQGYNPIHIARYGDLIDALNGQPQNYHQADVYPSGLDSPLVDVLGVRYILMPSVLAADQVAPSFNRPLTRAYADDTVQILENPSAFPRAWLVHAAVQVPPETAAAAITSDPPPDLRHVAILETSLPPLAQPDDNSRENVALVREDVDELRIDVSARAPGLVVLSEIAYPAWHATLDGQPVPILIADHALRSVAVPAGEHAVEMVYQSPATDIGLRITALTMAALLTLAILQSASRTRMLLRLLALAALLALPLGAGVGHAQSQAADFPLTITDDSGVATTFTAPPRRVVSLNPGLTEITFALGHGDSLVGVDSYSDYPLEAQNIQPRLRAFPNPSVEAIVALQPDLVLTLAESDDVIAQLRAQGVPVVKMFPMDYDATVAAVRTLGQLYGSPDAGEAIASDMTARRDAVVTAIAGAPRPRVYEELDASRPDMPFAAGPKGFYGQLIELAGGTNIFADLPSDAGRVGAESIVERDPEVIILTDSDLPFNPQTPDMVRLRPGWEVISAVRNGAIYAVPGSLYSTPGPRLALGLEDLARILHPDRFPPAEVGSSGVVRDFVLTQ